LAGAVAACAFGLCLAAPGLASANLVSDGSFDGTTASQPFQTIYAGNTFGGWAVTSGSIDLINGYWLAPGGNQSVDLAGNQQGSISQSITLPVGTYDLMFDLSGNNDGPPITKTVQVSLGTQSTSFNFTTAGTGPSPIPEPMTWVEESWIVSLTTPGAVNLVFSDISGGAGYPTPYGAVIANVSLSQVAAMVPEPGTIISGALLAFPFGIGAFRIFRRNRNA